MNVIHYAERLLCGDTLEDKLASAPEWTDDERCDPWPWVEPGRPADLRIAPKRTRKRLPHPDSLDDPEMRVRCLHTFANHELMAIELMAWALLAYPDAPTTFRRGLLRIIADEQRHLRTYMERIAELGSRFGDLPVNDHFWRCAPSLTTPLKWVSAMSLVFEQANLDHAPQYAAWFERVGDGRSAQIMRNIEADEIHHVGFGARFLYDNTPETRSAYDVWVENLTFHNEPSRARGDVCNREARVAAGLGEDFIDRLAPGSKRRSGRTRRRLPWAPTS